MPAPAGGIYDGDAAGNDEIAAGPCSSTMGAHVAVSALSSNQHGTTGIVVRQDGGGGGAWCTRWMEYLGS